MSRAPSPSTNRADTTDFDSNGQAEHLVMERGLEFTIAGHALDFVVRLNDPLGGSP